MTVVKERYKMDKKLYKCFECGKLYENEQAAIKCHNAPIQLIVQKEDAKKPRFLGA
jgi:DNA-directed RNA polymerase subunit RPC12/RpoP